MSPCARQKCVWGSRNTSITPLILALGTTSRKVESFQKWGKTSQYPLKGGLDGPQSWSGRFAKDKNDFPLEETENNFSAVHPAASLATAERNPGILQYVRVVGYGLARCDMSRSMC